MNVVNLVPSPPTGELEVAGPDHHGEPAVLATGRLDAEPIGAPLESMRADLLRHGQHLAALIPEAGAAFVRDALRVLEAQVCRIAVVGQVRAGKSSFINAFAQRPGLLPVDVSPWTTAVTRLHFGWAGAPEGIAAEFQLFESDEWDRLAAGASRVRELTQQLVPGFEPELLGRHVEAMRQRAEQRLGERLPALMGAKHSHEAVTSDILARYLSPVAVPQPAEGSAGELSEITRSLDLYFAPGPFRFPLSIIEAPGLNDPFLVRDELTRQALEAADVHLYILDARQPLTTSDLAHLRLLRGLYKERVIVFINRIDQLGDIVGETRRVTGQVREALEREFPGLDIPVVAGSALWSNAVLRADQAEMRRVLTPSLVAYAKFKGALRPVEVKGAEGDGSLRDVPAPHLALALAACSGYPELAAALNRILPQSHPAHLMKQVAAYYAELAQLNETTLREEHRRQLESMEAQAAEGAQREQELQRIQGELACIRQIAAEVDRRLAGLQSTIDDIVAEHRDTLYNGLMKSFEAFVQAEGERLLDDVGAGRVGRQWRCDTSPLRDTIDQHLQGAFLHAQERLRVTEHNVFPVLRETMLRAFPALELPAPAAASEEPPVMVMAAPLPENVVLDAGRSLWPLGRSRSIAGEEPDRDLERALREEFVPTIEQLMRSANTRLQRHAHDISEVATRTSVAVMDTLRKESDALIARAAVLLEERDRRVKDEQAVVQAAADQRERLIVAEALGRRLAELNARLAAMVG